MNTPLTDEVLAYYRVRSELPLKRVAFLNHEARSLLDELVKSRKTIAAIREQHSDSTGGGWCDTCGFGWPCHTRRILDEEA